MVFWNILKIATFARFMFYLYIFLGCKFSINGNQQSQLKNKHLNVFFFFNWQHCSVLKENDDCHVVEVDS